MVKSLLEGCAVGIGIVTVVFIIWVVVTYKRSKKNQHVIFVDQNKWGEG